MQVYALTGMHMRPLDTHYFRHECALASGCSAPDRPVLRARRLAPRRARSRAETADRGAGQRAARVTVSYGRWRRLRVSGRVQPRCPVWRRSSSAHSAHRWKWRPSQTAALATTTASVPGSPAGCPQPAHLISAMTASGQILSGHGICVDGCPGSSAMRRFQRTGGMQSGRHAGHA